MVRSAPVFDNRCRPCVPAGEYPAAARTRRRVAAAKQGQPFQLPRNAAPSGSPGNHSGHSFGPRASRNAQRSAVPVFRQLLNTASPGRSDRPGAPAQRRMMRLLSSASGSGAGTKSE